MWIKSCFFTATELTKGNYHTYDYTELINQLMM